MEAYGSGLLAVAHGRMNPRQAIAVDCVVVHSLTNGAVRLQNIQAMEESVDRRRDVFSGGPTLYEFMQRYARVWGSMPPADPTQTSDLWPNVLIGLQLMSSIDLPEPPPEPPKPKKRKRKKRKRKVKVATKTRWERMLEDDD